MYIPPRGDQDKREPPLEVFSFHLEENLAVPGQQPWFSAQLRQLGGQGCALGESETALEAPGVVSLPLRTQSPKTKSYRFASPAVDAIALAKAQDDSRPARPATERLAAKKGRTRFQPPSDVVKLADRLFYLLQPPLEAILSDGPLDFPFQPFPYQLEGIAFLYPRHHAVLADEMGLGKTMQSISAIRLLLHAGELQRVLLVCPKPLVTNWQREFDLWAPELPIHLIAGDQTRRHWQWTQTDAVVTIANYELLLRDRQLFDTEQVNFDLVVLDESQRIKNTSSTTSQVIRSISRRRSWALTGTPIENSTDDLHGIFEFVTPGLLRQGMKPRAIAHAISDYVLRRTKDRVLTDMPPKMFRDADIELSPEQRATYDTAENEGVVRLSDMGDALTIQHVFELVLRLKQICNFDPLTGASSKLERLEADLEECAASGRKAIVFSQWVGTLRQIKGKLARFNPMEYHGQIPSKQRETIVERFREREDSSVILMSYGAGSVGLNLQFCSYVFLFDRWWNPAVEDQAINRAHRIGAAGPVTVTRFLSLGTIEQRIDEVLQAKRELFDTIFAGDHHTLRSTGMTEQEIFGLFKLRSPQGPIRHAA